MLIYIAINLFIAGIIVLVVITGIILKSDALSVSLSHESDGVRVIVSRGNIYSQFIYGH